MALLSLSMQGQEPGANHPDAEGSKTADRPGPAGQVARLERHLLLLSEHLRDMVYRFECWPEPRFDYVSSSSVSIAGYTPEEHYANPSLFLDFIHPDDQDMVAAALADRAEDVGDPLVVRWIHKDGNPVVTEQHYRLERDDNGGIVAIEGVARDITGRLRRERELEHEATHDPVTGLANSRLLEEELERHLLGDHDELVVAALRLDRFAIVRDLVGASVAEAMLRDAAERLRLTASAGSLAVKGTADLFWFVFPETGRAAGEPLLQTLHDVFRDPIVGEGQEIYLSATIGARLVQRDESVAVETVLNDADTALRAVRRRGARSSSRWYDPALHRAATERLELEHDLREAVADGDITIAYQPQVSMATSRIVGFEALARWDRPGHGPVRPDLFIAVAEESGLIADLGDHVLFTVARQFARWRAAGLIDRQRVSVNVSRLQLELPDLAESVLEIISAVGLPPTNLTVEVTETAVMDGGNVATAQLEQLVQAGVRISLDDFGTGYSSLGSLRDLPVHELKIDRSFVAEMVGSTAGTAICSAMIALGTGLGLDLIAEGVETEDQSRLLGDLGCPVGQGWLFSRPLVAADVVALLAPAP